MTFESNETDVLWGRVRTVNGEQLEERIEALVELADREHPDLPSYLLEELQREGTNPRWRDAVVIITERVLFPEPQDRRRAADSLRRHALVLRDAVDPTSSEALWAAIWRYTTLIPPAEVVTLLDFIRPSDAMTTQQVALQSIENMFSRRLPEPALALDALQTRVDALAESALAEARLDSAEERALVVSAYCAVAVLGSPSLGALTVRLLGLARRSICFQALQRLSPVAQAWSAKVTPGKSEPIALVSLRDALNRLEAALSEAQGKAGDE
ncbi:MAG TPA: hypothetical protein VLS89_01445 [Candidatus Nanopelagicales bacterium]|nr:hypothetical protein [Candidatus Nanopelagicales bacterium]